MSRLDRRGRDPEPGDLRRVGLAEIASRTIVPFRKNGALRSNNEDISLNRSYQRFGRSKVMQQFVNRYLNEGGTSTLFGKNPKISLGDVAEGPVVIIKAAATIGDPAIIRYTGSFPANIRAEVSVSIDSADAINYNTNINQEVSAQEVVEFQELAFLFETAIAYSSVDPGIPDSWDMYLGVGFGATDLLITRTAIAYP